MNPIPKNCIVFLILGNMVKCFYNFCAFMLFLRFSNIVNLKTFMFPADI